MSATTDRPEATPAPPPTCRLCGEPVVGRLAGTTAHPACEWWAAAPEVPPNPERRITAADQPTTRVR